MVEITSRRNARVRLARSLRRAKGRREHGLFLVEGLRHIGELTESDFDIEFLLYAPETLTSTFGTDLVDRVKQAGAPAYSTTAKILDSLSDKKGSVGLLAIAHRQIAGLEDVFQGGATWSAAVTTPQDPGNIGTILRTMDAFGFGSLVLLDGGADPWQPACVRASMGALFSHPVIETDFNSFKVWAERQSAPIYGTSARGSTDLRPGLDLHTPALLLFGSERAGLSTEQSTACKQVFRIPMAGSGTSLNLAVAAGIAMFNVQGATCNVQRAD